MSTTSATRHGHPPSSSSFSLNREKRIKTLVILGSGGHTTEMIRLLGELDPQRYAPVSYVVADSDVTSIPRLKSHIQQQEEQKEKEGDCGSRHHHYQNEGQRKRRWEGRYPQEEHESNQQHQIKFDTTTTTADAVVHRLPRAREVHQSYLTSVLTTLRAIFHTLILVWKIQPELILANGPGTCVPVIYSVFLLQVILLPLTLMLGRNHHHRPRCKVVFVESICRVKTLSLSGRLVYPIVDRFLVHWLSLKERYPMVEVCDVFVRHDEET